MSAIKGLSGGAKVGVDGLPGPLSLPTSALKPTKIKDKTPAGGIDGGGPEKKAADADSANVSLGAGLLSSGTVSGWDKAMAGLLVHDKRAAVAAIKALLAKTTSEDAQIISSVTDRVASSLNAA